MRDLRAPEVSQLFERLAVEDPDHRSVAADDTRLVEWRRCDGSLAGRFLFHDAELIGFQWQEGSNWARAVDQRTYDEVRTSWFPGVPDRTAILEGALERLRRRSL